GSPFGDTSKLPPRSEVAMAINGDLSIKLLQCSSIWSIVFRVTISLGYPIMSRSSSSLAITFSKVHCMFGRLKVSSCIQDHSVAIEGAHSKQSGFIIFL